MDTEVKTPVVFYVTKNGLNLGKHLKVIYPGTQVLKFKPEDVVRLWHKNKTFIFIMASGIAVRTIAPLIKDKRTDPAVVVLDEKGRYAVSLLSGHLGGANRIAKEVAGFFGGRPVITTASDISNLTAMDLWAEGNNLAIENWNLLPKISTRLIDNGRLNVYVEQVSGIKLPAEFLAVKAPKDADVIITNKAGGLRALPAGRQVLLSKLFLRPKDLVIGIGCNSGTSAEEIESAVKKTLKKNNLSFLSIHSIATIDIKGRETGLIAFAKKYNFKINTFTPDEINSVISNLCSLAFNFSAAAYKATGAKGVAEPAAILAAETDNLLVLKQKSGNLPVAKANLRGPGSGVRGQGEKLRTLPTGRQAPKSKLYIVGIGPGDIEHITPEAQRAIKESDVIVGYGTYLDLIKELIKDKEVVSTGMTQEIDRCKKAVELAVSGKNVSVISGGDPGIYAMAGLVFEVLRGQGVKGSRGQGINKSTYRSNPRTPAYRTGRLASSNPVVKVVPGISALNACASRLGAPLMHDFASISLSDRLTPWKLIEKRLNAAAMADFVIVLYNPKSKGRAEHIKKALKIISKHRNSGTPVGIVKGAMRENEKIVITNLKNMLKHDIDMQTTVIIGNSQTYVWEKWMITPRGYENKKK
ncbi:MAG: cobalamin biosynthesis protein [Nitrospirae bacterium]|nr:cobalamin biosynthesis protein [Nitrospirota bacterium]